MTDDLRHLPKQSQRLDDYIAGAAFVLLLAIAFFFD